MAYSLLELKERFHTKCYDQSEFAEKARLLQSIWRVEQKIPINEKRGNTVNRKIKTKITNDDGTVTNKVELKTYTSNKIIGNYIDSVEAESKMHYFISKPIAEIVNAELEANEGRNSKDKKVLKKDRLLENMLSSQPLAFNLFGELSLDKVLAAKVFKSLFPDRIIDVICIQFEISPGRGDKSYTGDHSAFDVFVEYDGIKGKGFIGIEVKYAETLNDVPASIKGKKYKEVAETSNVFTANGIKYLCTMPESLEQIWRDHLLALSILQHPSQKYQEGFFLYLYPKGNKECSEALSKYRKYLKSENPGENGIHSIEMETLVEYIKQLTSADWIDKFYNRYLNFDKITKYQNS